MIVCIEASGKSFRGAGRYYLHDKLPAPTAGVPRPSLNQQSAKRVRFALTRNCMNAAPVHALDEMWRTAQDQSMLKAQAGVKRGGRVCHHPVKTISLSWHKDDQPEPQHMIAAADAFIHHMGWHKHQAVYIAHSDTAHRHIHIIVNRMHPETGRTLDDYREHRRAQTWALAYETEHGITRCKRRYRPARAKEHQPRRPATRQAAKGRPSPHLHADN